MEAAIGSLLVLAATPGKPALDGVFILTDGHINAGMTSSAGLLRLLAHHMNAGVPINTLGYGADHNSRLLRDMALRSRGTYTYADAGEVLPAIIGDIMGGLEAEVGRQAKLAIPDGWTCLELQPVQEGAYCVGTLIADKPQWVVLEGAAGTSAPPTLTLTWVDTATRTEQSATMALDMSAGPTITMLEVMEQRERCRVASVFAAVTEDLEAHRLDDARTKLRELATALGTSFAKDTPFVIRLQAQVEDTLDSLGREAVAPAMPATPFVGGLNRAPVLGAWPSVVSETTYRLASNTTVLVNQRGIMSSAGASLTPAAAPDGALPPPPHPLLHTALFSSPSQRSASNRMTNAYNAVATAGADPSSSISAVASDDEE
jgi:hypothetical protein